MFVSVCRCFWRSRRRTLKTLWRIELCWAASWLLVSPRDHIYLSFISFFKLKSWSQIFSMVCFLFSFLLRVCTVIFKWKMFTRRFLYFLFSLLMLKFSSELTSVMKYSICFSLDLKRLHFYAGNKQMYGHFNQVSISFLSKCTKTQQKQTDPGFIPPHLFSFTIISLTSF